jgi:hypothetical protein
MINIARWSHWVTANNMVFPIAYSLNKTITDPSNRRSLNIGFHFVEKTYLNFTQTEKDRVLAFYRESTAAPFLEKLTQNTIKDGKLKLYLTPVGLQRLPTTEKELGHAIYCIAAALSALHQVKWMHNDIRWPNIVLYRGDWVLIDCEYVRREGEALPANLPLRCPNVARCCPVNDIYLVGQLLNVLPPQLVSGECEKFRDLLLHGTELKSLKGTPWFSKFATLRSTKELQDLENT